MIAVGEAPDGHGLETSGAVAIQLAVEASLEHGDRIVACRNCAFPVLGLYCGQCGQAVDTHRRSVFHLLYDLIKDVCSFDSRILRTVHALFLEPGELPKAFREGRTQRYVPPIRLYLFVSLVFFLFLSTTNIAIVQIELTATKHQSHRRLGGELDVKPHFFTHVMPARSALPADVQNAIGREKDILAKELVPGANAVGQVLEVLASNPSAINRPLTDWIPRILFILLPGFAFVLALFYWRYRTDFLLVDHLVFALGIQSFVFAITFVAIALAQFLDGGLMLLFALCTIWLYLILAMKRFYRQGWGWTFAKFFMASAVYGAVFLAPAVAGIFAISLLNI